MGKSVHKPIYTTAEIIDWINTSDDYDELHLLAMFVSTQKHLYCYNDLLILSQLFDWKRRKLKYILSSEDITLMAQLEGKTVYK